MVAYFQYKVADSIRSQYGDGFIFAIEESEIHLLPGAQRLLINALNELGSMVHTVIFTTHSPVFTSISPKDSLVLVKKDFTDTKISQIQNLDIIDITNELGIYVSDRLVGVDNVVLVEGKQVDKFWNVVLEKLYNEGKTSLNPPLYAFDFNTKCPRGYEVLYCYCNEISTMWEILYCLNCM